MAKFKKKSEKNWQKRNEKDEGKKQILSSKVGPEEFHKTELWPALQKSFII